MNGLTIRSRKKFLKSIWKQRKMNTKQSKTYKTQWRQSWEWRSSNAGLPEEDRKISNDLTLHLEELEEEQQTKHRVSRRKEIIDIRELSDIETKK